MGYFDIIKSHVGDIIASFFHQLSSKYAGLTPSEIKVASFVIYEKCCFFLTTS